MDNLIVVNIEEEGDFSEELDSVIKIPCNISWADLELLLKLRYNCEELVVKYIDEENEEVIVSSEEELTEAFQVSKQCQNTLNLKVRITKPPPIQIIFEYMDQGKADVATNSVNMESNTTDKDSLDQSDLTLKEPMDMTSETPIAEPHYSFESEREYFFIQNSSAGKVLDVQGHGTHPGTPLILWGKKDSMNDNQLFWEDKQLGTIRCKHTGMCIDANGSGAAIRPCESGRNSQQWMIRDRKVVHRFNTCWVLEAHAHDQADVHAADYQGSANQLWDFPVAGGESTLKCGNAETGERTEEMVPLLATCPRPSRLSFKARPKKLRKMDQYLRLADELGHLCCPPVPPRRSSSTQNQCSESGEAETQPPVWFKQYMDKMKSDLGEGLSREVSGAVTQQILQGLEGAVITTVRGQATPGEPTPNSDSNGNRVVYHHAGVMCDVCENDIVGVRYKCGNCPDYDLCEICEATQTHDPEHTFLKIVRPTMYAGRRKNGRLVPLLKRSLYVSDEQIEGVKAQEKELKKQERQRRRDERQEDQLRRQCQRLEEKLKRKEEKVKKCIESVPDKPDVLPRVVRQEEKMKRRLEQQRDGPYKREKLDLPQFRIPQQMDASFVKDETIKDGTNVKAGTKMVKQWVLKNRGLHPWTSSTKLKMVWGNIPAIKTEVSVPYLRPDEAGLVTVELIAPDDPGIYQSHWRLHHHGMRFGHRVWCSIAVQEREILEPSAPITFDMLKIKNCDEEELMVEELFMKKSVEKTEKESTGVMADMITETEMDKLVSPVKSDESLSQLRRTLSEESAKQNTRELLLEVISMTDEDDHDRRRHTPKVSQTATPTNTPLVVSPPKSPTPEDQHLLSPLAQSTGSSVDILSDLSKEDNMTDMTILVQERIARLGLSSVKDDDIESLGSVSQFSSDSENDFYIVPLPDCFDTNKPLSLSMDLEDKTVDEMLTASNKLEAEPLIPAFSAQPINDLNKPISLTQPLPPIITENVEPELIMLEGQCPDRMDNLLDVQATIAEDDNTEDEAYEVPAEGEVYEVPEEHAEATQGSEIGADIKHESESTMERDVHQDMPALERDSHTQTDRTHQPSPPRTSELASTIVSAALGVASQAASSAYNTAKDVFKTLQAQSEYVPPKSKWTPGQSEWKPSQSTWTPPQNDWVPPDGTWYPPQEDWAAAQRTPMDQLIEMGFGERETNEKLLEKYNNNIERVVQELLQGMDNNWHESRH